MNEQLTAMKEYLARQQVVLTRQQTTLSMVDQLVRDLTALGVGIDLAAGTPAGVITLTIRGISPVPLETGGEGAPGPRSSRSRKTRS